MPSLEFLMSVASFGLGYGSCRHCGVEDIFDSSSCFDGTYFCRLPDCRAAGYAALERAEEYLRYCKEQERRSKEEWEAADARRRARWAEEDAAYICELAAKEAARQTEEEAIFQMARQQRIQQPLHQKYLCECCNGETGDLRLKKGELLCDICAQLPSRA